MTATWASGSHLRGAGRAGIVIVLGMLLASSNTPPASADPARPTNYRSEVTDISPADSGLTARVVGGDAFLLLEVGPGVQATVAGYGGEPYLRFDPDGTVWVNTRSPAHYLNDDRFGQSAVPADAAVDAEPSWELIRTDGTHGWHDHRIHWMAPAPPPGIDTHVVSKVLDWTVPVDVVGVQTTISGTLTWHPSISPFPWIALMALAALGGMAASRLGRTGAAILALAAAVAALLVGGAEIVAAPAGAGQELLAVGPPTVALIFGLFSLLHRRSPVPLVVSGVLLAVWGMLRATTLWMPELPTRLAPTLERGLVALTGGVAVALVVSALQNASAPPAPDRAVTDTIQEPIR